MQGLAHPDRDGTRFLRRHLVTETNAALERGALVALVLGIISNLTLPLVMLLGLAHGLWVPWVFTFGCTLACAMLYVLARRRQVRGTTAYLVLLPFVSLPTDLF